MSEQEWPQHRPTLVRTPSYGRVIERFHTYLTNNAHGIIDNPIRYVEDYKLPQFLEPLYEKLGGLVTMEELVESAKLAKQEHLLATGQQVDSLTEAEKISIDVQRSGAFWREPKDLLQTLSICCLASMVQGWDQVANGNLGWTDEFGILVDPRNPSKADGTLKFATVQAVPWFSASILGSYLSDPLSEFTGRRVALFTAAAFSFTSSIAGSRAKSWKALIGTRVLLGLGIGGKASIVPVLESEMLPPSKRGRLLVSWQVFDAAGVFFGSIACYILRDSWRNQILSGAIPAFALLIGTYAACESPRWLIMKGRYSKAFETLLRLRKERRLALKELESIHYQIQVERRLLIRRKIDDDPGPSISPFETELGRSSWWDRFRNMIYIPRIRRAATAAMIVMISQNLSGVNIYAFLATQFYSTVDLSNSTDYSGIVCFNNKTSHNNSTTDACRYQLKNEARSFRFAIGFGAANMIFSCLAYFLIENKEPEDADSKLALAVKRAMSNLFYFFMGDMKSKNTGRKATSPKGTNQDTNTSDEHSLSTSPRPVSNTSVENGNRQSESRPSSGNNQQKKREKFPEYKELPRFRGRRFLLLMSFAAGVVTLFLSSMMFKISENSGARLRMIAFFMIVFTAFYSPGAGAVPFLYCAEIFPNEGRELGMSWSTFWNFLGSGIVALSVPFGINWGHSKLLGLFSGLNALAFILVWFCVYSTNHTTTLEDYNYVFGRRMRDHMNKQAMRLWHWNNEHAPNFHWDTGTVRRDDDWERNDDGAVREQRSQQKAPVLPQIRRVSTNRTREDDDIELSPLSNGDRNV